jgi:LacI family transcriptional regulator
VFAGNFMSAVGALSALKEAGLKVPEEISIIGLHDSPIAEVLDPPLTVVKMPLREMGRCAAEMLISLLENKTCRIPQVLLPRGADHTAVDSRLSLSIGSRQLCPFSFRL